MRMKMNMKSLCHGLIRIALGAVLVCSLPGCEDPEADLTTFRQVVPSPTGFALTYPGTTLEAPATIQFKPYKSVLLGDVPPLYRFATKTLGRIVRTTEITLGPPSELLKGEPILQENARAVWEQALGPGYWRLTAVEVEPQHYEFAGFSRPIVDDKPYLLRIAGTRLVSPGGIRVSGSFWTNLNNDPEPSSQGKVLVVFALENGVLDLTIHYYGYKVKNMAQPISATYRIRREANGAGFLECRSDDFDIFAPVNNSKKESMLLRVQWDHQGNGRGDGYVFNGDVADSGIHQALITECWSGQSHGLLFSRLSHKHPGIGPPTLIQADGEETDCPPFPVSQPFVPQAPPEPSDAPWMDLL
jgi:hypothetical protein